MLQRLAICATPSPSSTLNPNSSGMRLLKLLQNPSEKGTPVLNERPHVTIKISRVTVVCAPPSVEAEE